MTYIGEKIARQKISDKVGAVFEAQNKTIQKQKERISELQSALREIEDTVDNWGFGWDGDCGLSNKIGAMVDKALVED